MITMKDFFLRPTFDSEEEAKLWEKLQKTVTHTKQFNQDFDHIVMHRDLFGTFFFYYLQEIRLRIIQILMEFTVVEWREPQPANEVLDRFGKPVKRREAEPDTEKELVIPEYGIRVKGWRERLPMECCGENFRNVNMLKLHYHAVHEKHYLFEANTCEVGRLLLFLSQKVEVNKFKRIVGIVFRISVYF
uniref:Uncharacterized protein n=1 Tax=Culex tarsalis TaxID=7177 RepID=A0A1Q3FJ41_CULTA